MNILCYDKLRLTNLISLFFIATTIFTFIVLSSREGPLKGGDRRAEPDDSEWISINSFLSNEMSDLKETVSLDRHIEKFLSQWNIKGAGLAIMKNGKLVYSKGYGWADEENKIEMDAKNIFRIASLSKLITASAVMKLSEDSLLKLSDKVFGEGGILNCDPFREIKDPRMKNITVEHLLRHQGGFTLHRGDPLFTTREIMLWEKLDSVPDMDRVIQYLLKQRLGFAPGSGFRYSNAGYLILSRVIEEVSGLSYEKYCQAKILHPSGCYDFHLAKNLYEERYPNEVRYYESHDAEPIPAYNNSGRMLPRSYGGNNIAGLYGAGGWVASPAEVALFVSAIDGREGGRKILSDESIRTMICCDGGKHAIGWARASQGSDWVRTGTLAGSSALVKVLQNGYTWIFITNTSSWKGSRFTKYIEGMLKKASSGIEWPQERDLFVQIEKAIEINNSKKENRGN